MREARLLRVGRAILPLLQFIEQAAFPPELRLLDGKSSGEILRDSRAIERALTLFDVAWETRLVRISVDDAATEARGSHKPVAACGLSITDAQQYFLMMAMALIFAENGDTLERLKPFVTSRKSLPRMRSLASIDAGSLAELEAGWGRRFPELLTVKPDRFVEAVQMLQPFQWRGLRGTMGAHFVRTLDWTPEMLGAVAKYLRSAEQFQDLGDHLLLLDTPEKLRAVGRWEVVREVGGDEQSSARTGIGGIKTLLGQLFGVLLERDAVVIELFGEMFAAFEFLDRTDKALAIEQFQTLAKRYLPYLTGPTLQALTNPPAEGAPPLNMAEINGLLEGLWRKEGFGQPFFEGPFQSAAGTAAMARLVKAYAEMKGSGVAKSGSEATALIANSDLFDRNFAHLARHKKKTQGVR